MFSFIERLQQASLIKRKSVAFSVSTLLTLIVFGFWLLTFTRTQTSVIATNVAPQGLEQNASPLEAIRHAAKSIFGGTSSTYEHQ